MGVGIDVDKNVVVWLEVYGMTNYGYIIEDNGYGMGLVLMF